jgi:hypothetical protein
MFTGKKGRITSASGNASLGSDSCRGVNGESEITSLLVTPFSAYLLLSQFQSFQLHPVGANVGKIVLRLLHKPGFGAATENL